MCSSLSSKFAISYFLRRKRFKLYAKRWLLTLSNQRAKGKYSNVKKYRFGIYVNLQRTRIHKYDFFQKNKLTEFVANTTYTNAKIYNLQYS